MPSHASEGTTGMTWPQRDVDIELCWRQYYYDDIATQGCTRCGKVAQPPSSEHRGVVAL
jgi:hypothetical protein